jgi:2'-5' RNA ligase
MKTLKQIIKENLKLLTEEKKATYEYGCVMLYLDFERNFWNRLSSLIKEEDLFLGENNDERYGFESEPHITLLYGIHNDVPDSEVETKIKQLKIGNIDFTETSKFDSEDYDVLKFTVKGETLNKANELLKELPHTSSFPNYEPHATIAYLKKGMFQKYKTIIDDFIFRDFPDGVPFVLDRFVFSKADGTKIDYPII